MERCIAWTSPANQMILGCLGQWTIDWRCCELLGKCSLLPCPIMPRISWLFLDPLFFLKCCTDAYFKFMLLTFYSDPTTTDTIFKAVCISKTFCSFAGSGWPWLDLWFHGFPWLWGELLGIESNGSTGRCSAGLQLEPPLMFNHFYLHLN